MADDDLEVGLAGLAGLLTGGRPLRDSLVDIAQFASRAIPGAEGVGLTMLDTGRPQTVVASDPFVTAVDDVQYHLGEGPCLLAVSTGEVQTSGSLGGEARWPRFGPRVGRLGVHSALSLPLVVQSRVTGALNVYSRQKDAFGAESVRIGEHFAGPAAASVHNAHVLDASQRTIGQLQAALVNRSVIDQALGIMMARTGADADEAFERLRTMSQTRHEKVADLARSIVDEAVRRARAQRPGAPERPTAG